MIQQEKLVEEDGGEYSKRDCELKGIMILSLTRLDIIKISTDPTLQPEAI